MVFGNNGGGGGYNRSSVNTGVMSFYSDLSSCTIGCWDDKFSIRFSPCIGKDDKGITRYDKDTKIKTSLSLVKAGLLLKKYEKEIKPMIEGEKEKVEKNVGVLINSKEFGTCLLLIEYKQGEKGFDSYLTFARNLSPEGIATPENVISCKFRKTPIVEDMDIKSGKHTESFEEGELMTLMDIFKFRIMITGLGSHAARYSASFSRGGNNSSGGSNNNTPDFSGSGDFMNMSEVSGDFAAMS